MRRIVLSLSAAALLVTAPGPALAQVGDPLTVFGQRDPEQDVVVRVPYGDLELTDAAARATLQERVKDASKRVCERVYPRFYSSQKWNCFDAAMRVAQPQMDRAFADAGRVEVARATNITLAFAMR